MRLPKCDPAIAEVMVLLFVASAVMAVVGAKGDAPVTQLSNGFTARHTPDAPSPFEPVLYAANGAFAFGFLRVGAASLDLAVVHLPSSFPLWRATPARVADWSRPATLTFDRGLVLAAGDVTWQTLNAIGDTVVLLNSSNLVVRRFAETAPTWQSFDHPSNTLVLDQNFTVSSPPLISDNGRFALRMSRTYMSLHMEVNGGRLTSPAYWQHTALEADPENATQPAVYGRIDGRGFFGLYLTGGGEKVDVITFDTFVQNLTAGAFRRMTLEDDGNLRAYYWTNDAMAWTSDYKAISSPCELPTSCGAYGLCVPGAGGESQCQCLSNTTGAATSPPCGHDETTDLCGSENDDAGQVFDEIRRTRVSVAYKERVAFETNTTAAQCEEACAGNCSCWGALHNGGSGYCYLIDFPVETMVYEADDRKVGYFKVRRPSPPARSSSAMSHAAKAVTAVLSIILASLAVAGAYVGYRLWQRRQRRRRFAGGSGMEQELTSSSGPYKDLKSMGSSNSSFKS